MIERLIVKLYDAICHDCVNGARNPTFAIYIGPGKDIQCCFCTQKNKLDFIIRSEGLDND